MASMNDSEASDTQSLRTVERIWPWPLSHWFEPKPRPDYVFGDGSNYVRVKNLGTDGCGRFYLCRDCGNGKAVIVKDIRLDFAESIQITLKNQVSLIEELDHPNIVRLLKSMVDDRFIWLVFGRVDCNLKVIIFHQDYSYNPLITKSYLHQMLSAIAYCHDRGILHRNLNPESIRIDLVRKKVKVDFSMAIPVRVPDATNTFLVGTRGYKAPEILLTNLEHSTAIDMWSLGCIFGEMVTGQKLFLPVADRLEELVQIFRLCGFPTEETWPGFTEICTYNMRKLPCFSPWDRRRLFPRLEPLGLDLLSKMLSLNPNRRISARDALDHPYFNDLDPLISPRVLDMVIMFCCPSTD